MKVRDLISEWQANSAAADTMVSREVRMTGYDAAKVAALCDIFPGVDEQRILTDLVAAALDELSGSFAYEPGDEIAGYDETGEPMYADAGLRPRFQQLARRYMQELESEQSS